LCLKCLNLNKSTYYKNKDKEEDDFERKYQNLKNKVKKIILENPSYGYRRIKTELKDNYQVILNGKTIRKLLKMWNSIS